MILNPFSENFILEALEFILRNNNFKFDEIFYNQTKGTAMETKCALFRLSYQNVFHLKKLKLLKKYSDNIWTMDFYCGQQC